MRAGNTVAGNLVISTSKSRMTSDFLKERKQNKRGSFSNFTVSDSGEGWVAEMAKVVGFRVWGHPRSTPAPAWPQLSQRPWNEMQQIMGILNFSGVKMCPSGHQRCHR